MKRMGLLLCICILLAVSVTGCWSRRELNDLAIAVGLGIDKVGNKYNISVQVVEPSEVSGNKRSGLAPVTMYHATADSLLEALRKMTTISPRKIYIAHLRIVVISEALAREGIGDALDFISRDPEARNDFFVVVAKDAKAMDTLKILTNLEKVPAVRLFTTLKTSEKQWAPTTAVKLDELIADLVSEGREPVLTGLRVIGDPEVGDSKKNVESILSPTDLQYSGLAVFRKDKLIGWLSDEEGRAYNFINNNINSTAGSVDCPDGGKVTFRIIRADSKVKGSMRDGRPRIDIEVNTEAHVAEVQCSLDMTKPETIAELEKWAERKLADIIDSTIARVQQDYKVDIFGFGEAIRRSNPKAWKTMKNNWNQTFSNIPVNVKVNYKVQQLGKISNSFLEEIKEQKTE
ncbi:Ger(x)C family spore germination protein [Paenibacillus sp. FA6]|uniref:Ger(x)C family spore germination protein n=1 Tax=Paenibacillus sp. FA6 TaxID=3413029 RepID=UPI003F658FD6